jgi:hypothetical protein
MQITQKPQAWTRRGLLLGSLVVLMGSGCQGTGSYTTDGLGTGAILGGIAGTFIGAAAGRPLQGMAIGAAAGGAGGAIVGNVADRKEARQEARLAAARGPMGLEQVAQMAQEGVRDDVIIEQIRVSRVVYTLTSDQIVWLRKSGVSDNVIHVMLATGERNPGRVVYAPAPVYVVEPAPPPVGVGVGVVVGGRCR